MAYGESIETNATVDLNSQWVSDTEDNEYKYFKSNSYVGVNISYSQCKVTWSNLTSITFKYMSSSEMSYDYLCVGYLDGGKFTAQPSDGGDNVYLSTKGKTSGTYYEFTIECDEGEHHIWFCYRKDSSGNEGKDRGFIGVPKSVLPILDVKQGSELPMEYKSGGVSAEGGKTYDINFNNVTLPNGSYIVPSYEDYTKTEKSITYEYVDLGLPSGTLWAKYPIGASSETEDGVLFQWGETSGITKSLLGKYSDENYSWASYKYCNGSERTLTKYNTSTSYGENPDNITTLESVDDAATQIMGGDWRMPTKAEFQELIDNTGRSMAIMNDKRVYKFVSKTDKSKYICFFLSSYGNGNVWCSSLYTTTPSIACVLNFDSDADKYETINTHFRTGGLPVHGVHA